VTLPEQFFANPWEDDKENEAVEELGHVEECMVNPEDEHVELVVNDVTESRVLPSRSATPLPTAGQRAKRKATAVEADDEAKEIASPPTKKARSTVREGAEQEATPVEADDEMMFSASDRSPFNPDATLCGTEEEELKIEVIGVETNAMPSEKHLEDLRPDDKESEASQQVYMEMSVAEEHIVDAVVEPIEAIVGDVAESRVLQTGAFTPITTGRQGAKRKAITQGDDDEGEEADSPHLKKARSTAGVTAERQATPAEADDEVMSSA
jgi:hypothetical protein